MERFAREDVRAVLGQFGIQQAWRAADVDATEEVVLLGRETFQATDVRALTEQLMVVLPHTKVWVAERTPRWTVEPI